MTELWLDFYTELGKLKKNKFIIFTHNLGSFDGYFIYKGLFDLKDIKLDKINTIVDNRNAFITIDAEVFDMKLIWKDSIRIFPVSLNELCKLLKISGKLLTYNIKFNDVSLFKDRELLDSFIQSVYWKLYLLHKRFILQIIT